MDASAAADCTTTGAVFFCLVHFFKAVGCFEAADDDESVSSSILLARAISLADCLGRTTGYGCSTSVFSCSAVSESEEMLLPENISDNDCTVSGRNWDRGIFDGM